jgi:hypothetical protein
MLEQWCRNAEAWNGGVYVRENCCLCEQGWFGCINLCAVNDAFEMAGIWCMRILMYLPLLLFCVEEEI